VQHFSRVYRGLSCTIFDDVLFIKKKKKKKKQFQIDGRSRIADFYLHFSMCISLDEG
jgi:hypothetical protein